MILRTPGVPAHPHGPGESCVYECPFFCGVFAESLTHVTATA